MESSIPKLSSIPMRRSPTTAIKIIRRSIHTFLRHYNYFTSAAFLALPFSVSILLSSSPSPDPLSLQPTIQSRLRSIFNAAGFPPQSEFFSILSLKLSQTITSSVLVIPFTFSFLLIAKASIIQSLDHNNRQRSFAGIFNSLLRTQLWNSMVILSANATCFWMLFIAFNCLENLNISSSPALLVVFSAIGGIVYSLLLANALIICNLASVLSGMETSGGFISILKACVMIKGRTSTALSLALPINMALAATEALFQFRLIRGYSNSRIQNHTPSMVLEGLLIAYIHSILITLDTITGCVFFKSCKISYEDVLDQEQERRHGYFLEIKEEEEEEEEEEEKGSAFAYVKCSAEELP